MQEWHTRVLAYMCVLAHKAVLKPVDSLQSDYFASDQQLRGLDADMIAACD